MGNCENDVARHGRKGYFIMAGLMPISFIGMLIFICIYKFICLVIRQSVDRFLDAFSTRSLRLFVMRSLLICIIFHITIQLSLPIYILFLVPFNHIFFTFARFNLLPDATSYDADVGLFFKNLKFARSFNYFFSSFFSRQKFCTAVC